MRRRMILAAAVLCLAAPGLLHAAPWEFDPAHTGVHFKVQHLMVSSVRGEFEKISGKIVYDEADVTKSTADITIDAASVNTRVAKRDEDLRSPNFLDVAKYPTIAFKSKRVEKAGNGTLKMTGDLTIRDVTRPVTFDVEFDGRVLDPWGKDRAGFTASARINRKDFGVNWNGLIEAGGVVVSDAVKITLHIEVVKQD